MKIECPIKNFSFDSEVNTCSIWVVEFNNGSEKIMTKAKAIEVLANNGADACDLSGKYAIAADQDWSEGTTSFVFDDNSVLVCSGTSYFAREGETA